MARDDPPHSPPGPGAAGARTGGPGGDDGGDGGAGSGDAVLAAIAHRLRARSERQQLLTERLRTGELRPGALADLAELAAAARRGARDGDHILVLAGAPRGPRLAAPPTPLGQALSTVVAASEAASRTVVPPTPSVSLDAVAEPVFGQILAELLAHAAGATPPGERLELHTRWGPDGGVVVELQCAQPPRHQTPLDELDRALTSARPGGPVAPQEIGLHVAARLASAIGARLGVRGPAGNTGVAPIAVLHLPSSLIGGGRQPEQVAPAASASEEPGSTAGLNRPADTLDPAGDAPWPPPQPQFPPSPLSQAAQPAQQPEAREPAEDPARSWPPSAPAAHGAPDARRNGELPQRGGDLPQRNGELPQRGGDLPQRGRAHGIAAAVPFGAAEDPLHSNGNGNGSGAIPPGPRPGGPPPGPLPTRSPNGAGPGPRTPRPGPQPVPPGPRPGDVHPVTEALPAAGTTPPVELFGPFDSEVPVPVDDVHDTPIFAAVASAWFRDPVATPETTALPVSDGSAPAPQSDNWRTPGDEEFDAARIRADRVVDLPTTAQGLPQRLPGQAMVPPSWRETTNGSAPSGSRERQPDRVRSRLASYQRGLREGRHRANEDPPPANGAPVNGSPVNGSPAHGVNGHGMHGEGGRNAG
ncbi:hypothetical protein WIS52_06590 [Pseudonocardia nematodicida]|uniref:Histidine kinase n=1 Tax=Pseudonocardia nematodicida TaxID=1206997 RepID=A0ABV1K6N5_9PSEU